VPVDEDQFVLSALKPDPMATKRDGIFAAGGCGSEDIQSSTAEARGQPKV
jgi:heterodisulfide reductase subunit A-like polyferredoxin